MAPKKKIAATLRIRQPAGEANVGKFGQMLGPHGVNIVQAVRAFNDATAAHKGLEVAADIVIYEDRSFELTPRTPSTAALLRQAADVPKGSEQPGRKAAASITTTDLRKIAEIKMPDLNTDDVDAAMKTIAGTARSMGITIVN